MTQSTSSVGIEQVIELLKFNFIAPDNIPEDTARRDQICMEARASLLIEANCTSKFFPHFMKCGTSSPKGWVYPLSPPYRMKFTDLRGKQFTWHFESFIISKEKTCINSRSSTLSRRHPYVKDNHFTLHIVEQDQLYGSTAEWDSNFILPFKRVLQEFNDQYRSRFQLCKGSSPYKTPEQVCYHFGSQGEVFAKLKSNDMHPDYFPASSDQALPRRDNQINWSDARVEQEILKQILPCSLLELWQPPLINKCYDNWFCQVFPFRNECGKITMQLIKLYDPEKQMKCLIPVTTWMRANCPYNQYFCVPLPEDKQPLYNLDPESVKRSS